MIKGFDGLRALAVILVFLNHWTDVGRANHTGDYGVWLFFVLSGFLIISGLYRDRLAHESGERAGVLIINFYKRRALRIFPAYYVTLLTFSGISLFAQIPNWNATSATYFYLYLTNFYIGYAQGQFIGWFSHFWSLAIEQQFYLLFGAAFILVPSRHTRGFCLSVIGLAIIDFILQVLNDAPLIKIYLSSLIGFGMIALGGFVALCFPEKPQPGHRSLTGLICLFLFIAGPFALTFLNNLVPEQRFSQASVIVAAALIASIYLNQKSLLVQFLELGPLRHLGHISYGFYIYHNLIPRTLFPWVGTHLGLPTIPRPANAVLGFFLSVALAELSWRLLERPILSLKNKIIGRDATYRNPPPIADRPDLNDEAKTTSVIA